MRILVCYYSRTGKTRAAAEAVAAELSAEVAEIREDRPRKGLGGFLRSGFEALTRKTVTLRPLQAEPEKFDRVVVCSPIWAGRLSSPVRSFLVEHAKNIRELGIVLTNSDPKDKLLEVTADIEAMVGKKNVFHRIVTAPIRS